MLKLKEAVQLNADTEKTDHERRTITAMKQARKEC